METKDTYKTITKPSEEGLFKDKNSKFFAYAFPVKSEDDVKLYLEKLKKEHYAARHWCYAYQLGTETLRYRANDDGEPNNSAGMPIYGQIQSFELTNVLVVVVRYFGGVKLGVGGLINAYRTVAQMALENTQIVEKTIDTQFKIQFDYKHMSRVMRILKDNTAEIDSQKLELDCVLTVSVRKGHANKLLDTFSSFYEISITKL
ncbi:MAG: YigZ family protein [Winogradskyella sp.]|uniref:IMPACT family protein n=1 Tax=Winogradskyella sp. TaxID=1883156 RepID=UPI0017F2770A|nr:YigZ family protein [Winogradskyella sp.]MBT8245825.1 IMPACT family protein [Winogradskyella sp.]NNK22596.1 YigZ family protein [Winogradskyella sp.]